MIVDRPTDHQGWWRLYAPLKRRSTIILHGSRWWRQYAPLKRRSTIILHGSRWWRLYAPLKRRSTIILHGSRWWRQYAPLKRRSTIILHDSTSQKTILNFILAAVRTWNLTRIISLNSVNKLFFVIVRFCYLCGTHWNLKYYLDELWFHVVNDNSKLNTANKNVQK
jgi:hypothetical protein